MIFWISRAETRRMVSFNAEARVISMGLHQIGGVKAASHDESPGYL